MKTSLVILLISSNVSAHTGMAQKAPEFDYKRVSHEIAYNHAPDFEMALQRLYEVCGEAGADRFSPDSKMGESFAFVPSSFSALKYDDQYGPAVLYWKCRT